MSSKKWLITFSFIAFIFILIIGLFNYKIDSLGLVTKKGYLDLAAKAIANGKIVSGLSNFDERLFRKKVINYIDYNIDWIAIGSSRTMQLRKSMFLNDKIGFQNYSVSGASLEDYIAILQTHHNKFNSYPKNIILGIDPWVFNKNNKQNRFLSLFSEYKQFISLLNHNIEMEYNFQNKYKKLFSIEYFIENLIFFKNNINNNLAGFEIVDTIDVNNNLREPDGSIRYSYDKRYPDFSQVKEDAIQYASGNVYSLENFYKLSKTKLFKKFINFLLEKQIEIYFYLPPYNPYTYNILIKNKEYKIIEKVEEFLIDFGQNKNIKVIGSYDPHKNGFTNKDFFDGMHSLDSVYINLFKDLYKERD